MIYPKGGAALGNIIEAKHLFYSYPSDDAPTAARPAVKDVSFEIKEGEFVCILGHNGSGKSTLAKLACLLLEPDDGELTVCGRKMTGEDVTDEDIYAARRDVGMVFQNPDNQIVATIVEEDVAFGCENLGMPSEEIRRRVDRALEVVGMTKYARHAASRLSGGQKQRVAIAGAIAMKRRCIIFDESTAMLDPLGRKEVMDTILRLNRDEGLTVVLITHYMNEAVLADRVIVMNDGSVMMTGTPSEVFSKVETLRSIDLDVPQTTELLWMMKSAGYDVRLDLFSAEECAEEIARVLK
jgi:energy-coupling factor transport system ATP-binding protein